MGNLQYVLSSIQIKARYGIICRMKKKCVEIVPVDYGAWVVSLKERVRAAQQRAAFAVNAELIRLYWDIGHEIIERQERLGWGAKVIPQLSRDLLAEFPEMKGFSVSNLKFMRMFAMAWTREQIGQQVVNQLPWGHNIVLMVKVESVEERLAYARLTLENGWSRNVLLHQIEMQTARRVGKALTNFRQTMPEKDSDLAVQSVKDPYKLQFLEASGKIKENELRLKLVDKVAAFLLELGAGFTYAGKAVPLSVGGDEFEMDLLFYNVRIHRFFVIELKTRKFRPQDVGQLGFYMTAVDEQIRDKRVDGETVGILLCKSRNRVAVEYSLKGFTRPMAVSTYELEKMGLPSAKQLEDGLTKVLCA